MADPITLGAMAIGGTIAGTALGVAGNNAATGAQVTQLQYQSALATRNKAIALQNADYARWAGESQAQRSGLATGQIVGAMKAGQGASNLDVNFGSNVQVRESQREVGWNDQQVIRSNAAQRAYAFENEAAVQDIKSQLAMKSINDVEVAGNLKNASTIIGGATSVATKWLGGSSTGMFSGASNALGNAFIPGNWGEQS